MRANYRLHPALGTVLLAFCLFSCGCRTGLGPRLVAQDRFDYNQQIIRSSNEQMLLNLVRLHYNDIPLFLELGSVVVQFGIEGRASAGGRLNLGAGQGEQALLDLGVTYAERPTILYEPLQGEEFATRLLSPIPHETLVLLAQTGWSVERLLLMCVQRINNVSNAPTATGPTPEEKPDYEEFAKLAGLLRRLQKAGLFEMNWEPETSKRIIRFWIASPSRPEDPYREELATVRKILGLPEERTEFTMTDFPFKRQPDQVGMRGRTMLGVLFYLSHAVESPEAHSRAGLVVQTKDENGNPFDWRKVMEKILMIRVHPEKPTDAYVSAKYRGYWFSISDSDRNSKATFSLLSYIISLQTARAKGKSPLLTLPIGE